jgi:purine-nucleoside phosphorylase
MHAHELGIKDIVLTNAAGQLSNSASVGTVVAISDHLNLAGQNVACITPKSNPIQFVDMAGAYNSLWTKSVCEEMTISTGVYAGMLGPTFESPAEAKMLKILGADLAGMSTVQETIASRMNGQNVFACSFVTNVAGGTSADHSDILKSVKISANHIQKTMESVLKHAPIK